MKILITGVCGFIGSYVAKRLNEEHPEYIIDGTDVVDELDDLKLKNLFAVHLNAFYDHDAPISLRNYDAIIHMGAISDPSCDNYKLMLDRNVDASVKALAAASGGGLNYSLKPHASLLFENFLAPTVAEVPGPRVIYASSAAVYGRSKEMSENRINEKPISMYGYTKLLVDNSVRSEEYNAVGLRFFNVYGPGEQHKIGHTSPIYSFYKQAQKLRSCSVFDVCAKRDFVHVEDCYKVIKHFMKSETKGVYNVGTGRAVSFEYVARLTLDAIYGSGSLFSPKKKVMPPEIKKRYQYETRADLTKLRTEYKEDFISIEDGVKSYVNYLKKESA